MDGDALLPNLAPVDPRSRQTRQLEEIELALAS